MVAFTYKRWIHDDDDDDDDDDFRYSNDDCHADILLDAVGDVTATVEANAVKVVVGPSDDVARRRRRGCRSSFVDLDRLQFESVVEIWPHLETIIIRTTELIYFEQ